jgi:hypothetical protein
MVIFNYTKKTTIMDYTQLTNAELITIVDPNVNHGGIPIAAVTEANKRGLKKKAKGTINSNYIKL